MMKEKDVDITEIIIKQMPEKTEVQQRIKLYMQTHKSTCNDYLYQRYKEETTYFNAILNAFCPSIHFISGVKPCNSKFGSINGIPIVPTKIAI